METGWLTGAGQEERALDGRLGREGPCVHLGEGVVDRLAGDDGGLVPVLNRLSPGRVPGFLRAELKQGVGELSAEGVDHLRNGSLGEVLAGNGRGLPLSFRKPPPPNSGVRDAGVRGGVHACSSWPLSLATTQV